MNKIVKDQIARLKPSATLAINEESNRLKKSGKKIYKFGFGQSPFPIPDSVTSELKIMHISILIYPCRVLRSLGT